MSHLNPISDLSLPRYIYPIFLRALDSSPPLLCPLSTQPLPPSPPNLLCSAGAIWRRPSFLFCARRREVKRHSLLLHASVTSAMVLPTGLLLYLRHPTLFTAYLGTVVLVTVACPLWLLRVQRYKLRIEGPWDIAHVEAHP